MLQNIPVIENQNSYSTMSKTKNNSLTTLILDGSAYKTRLTEKFMNRKQWKPTQKKEVYAEFPGTVIQVDVSIADVVKKGDRLYIYDAMKMHNRAYTPVEGRIKEIRIKAGSIIRKGDLLLVLE